MGCGSSKSDSVDEKKKPLPPNESIVAPTKQSNAKTPVVHEVMTDLIQESKGFKEAEVGKNSYSNGKLPELTLPDGPAHVDCSRGNSSSKWPIRCYMKLDPPVNVNAGPGGRVGLSLGSDTYGGPGSDTTAALGLICCGVEGSHFSYTQISGCHSGHFGPDFNYTADEDGNLLPDLLFGTNHIALVTNDCRNGNGRFGFQVDGPDQTAWVVLPVNVNGEFNPDKGTGGGLTLVLCSGWENDQFVAASYVIRLGRKDNHIDKRLVHGDDKWKWSCGPHDLLTVTGPSKSCYGGFHNRDNLVEHPQNYARIYYTQALSGDIPTSLIEGIGDISGVLYVLCSNSQGSEDSTAGAIYAVNIKEGKVEASLLKGSALGSYSSNDFESLWKFEVTENNLIVSGPKGPCRYSFLSNLPECNGESNSYNQSMCLATGRSTPTRGSILVDDKGVTGWVSERTDVLMTLQSSPRVLIKSADLKHINDKYAFQVNWTNDDKTTGLHHVRVFADCSHAKTGQHVQMELDGSPSQFVIQPPGVLLAYNCCGPTYQATNDVVYLSEHSHFVNFDYDVNFGSQHTSLGGAKHAAQIPQIISGTSDGFLFVTERSSGVEAVDEQKISYNLENLKNGKHILRLHFVPRAVGKIQVNGKNVSEQIREVIDDTRDVLDGHHAHTINLPVEVTKGQLTIYMTSHRISAFCLLDQKTYQDKRPSKSQRNKEADRKQKLADSAEPLSRTMSRKERKIVGWSPNLLVNASGENGNMTGWKCSGDWVVQDGGHGTEKTFVTSFMECWKRQDVTLTDHFTAEYLDTQPDIQVYEWHREGCCGGGHYEFKATLLSDKNKELSSFHFPRTGTIYRNSTWEEVGTTFKKYGKGARKIQLESMGKDDKNWQGHYGIMISNSVVRVLRETNPPENDAFADIFEENDRNTKARTSAREKLVAKILSDNEQLLDELIAEELLPADDGGERPRRVAKKRPMQKQREVRVFMSSTFRDFKQEREYLIKKTFTEINRMCADRGVFFNYVDLRWGITEEQTEHGQTIAICLQEIERCRPYFLCMMGERYGWAQPENKPDDLLNQSFDYAIDNFPVQLGWLERYRFNTSVTQLEILHGVLNDVDERKERSFFYLRDPAKEHEHSPEEMKILRAENEWAEEQQKKLRTRIKETAGLNLRTYKVTHEVCGRIKQDLEWCIDQDFPKGTELTALEREREAHTAFAAARRRVYIGREEYFEEIDKHMAEFTGVPLVVLGESGSGKSALVANWAGNTEDKEQETFFFVHFIGSSAESASYTKLLRRLFEEMKQYFEIDLAIPTSDSNLVRDFPTWLRIVGSQGKCVIVLDALNQMDDGSGTEGPEHDLMWIPNELPEGIYMLLSTLPGRAMNAIKSKNWPVMKVNPLQRNEKDQIVTGYFEKIYGKTLNEEQKDMLVNTPQTDNPLYLKALLDEIRMFGNFRKLSEKISEYLTAGDPGHLFAKILERLEDDFEKSDNGKTELVKQTTTAIWCSQRGMSESELLQLLDIPSAVWSPFYLSLVENLVNRNGIFNFFHDHLRQAVERKYLLTDADKKNGYNWLAEYFSNKDVDDRVAEELPFLLSKAGELNKLCSTITNLEVFKRLVKTEDGRFQLIRSWKLLGGFEEVENAYVSQIENLSPEDAVLPSAIQLQQDLAEFFMELGLYSAAQNMMQKLLVPLEKRYGAAYTGILYDPFNFSYRYRCQHPTVIDLLHKLGTVCGLQKKFEESLNYYRESLSRQTRSLTPDEKLQLAKGLLGQATILYQKGDMKEAKKFLVRAREVATDVLGARHHYVAAIINKLGQLCYKQGRVEEAFRYFIQDLTLTRAEVGLTHPRTANVLNDLALVYDDRNDDLAGSLYEAALAILLDTYGNNHLDVAVVRYNLGAFYQANDSKQRAKFQFTHAHKIYQTFLGDDNADTKEAASALSDC